MIRRYASEGDVGQEGRATFSSPSVGDSASPTVLNVLKTL
jgi:hypothetical protein